MIWENSLAGTAGRDGLCCMWDVNSGVLILKLEEHKSPIHKMQLMLDEGNDSNPGVLVTGDADGVVCLWDLRMSHLIEKVQVSQNAVTDISVSNPTDTPHEPSPQIIVSDGEGILSVLDPRGGFQIRKQMKGHKDEVTKIIVRDNIVASCGGNGWVLVHDFLSGKCLYGLEAARQGASTCIEIAPKTLVTAGDDGNLYLFDYI